MTYRFREMLKQPARLHDTRTGGTFIMRKSLWKSKNLAQTSSEKIAEDKSG